MKLLAPRHLMSKSTTAIFNNYASGKPLLSCGISDYHIGGLSLIPALIASMEALEQNDPSLQLEKSGHPSKILTHDHKFTLRAATDLTRIYHSYQWRIHPPHIEDSSYSRGVSKTP